MLRIRFGKEGVTVYSIVGNASNLEVKENYMNTEVEIQEAGGFWHKVDGPLKALKAGALFKQMVDGLSERTGQDGQ